MINKLNQVLFLGNAAPANPLYKQNKVNLTRKELTRDVFIKNSNVLSFKAEKKSAYTYDYEIEPSSSVINPISKETANRLLKAAHKAAENVSPEAVKEDGDVYGTAVLTRDRDGKEKIYSSSNIKIGAEGKLALCGERLTLSKIIQDGNIKNVVAMALSKKGIVHNGDILYPCPSCPTFIDSLAEDHPEEIAAMQFVSPKITEDKITLQIRTIGEILPQISHTRPSYTESDIKKLPIDYTRAAFKLGMLREDLVHALLLTAKERFEYCKENDLAYRSKKYSGAAVWAVENNSEYALRHSAGVIVGGCRIDAKTREFETSDKNAFLNARIRYPEYKAAAIAVFNEKGKPFESLDAFTYFNAGKLSDESFRIIKIENEEGRDIVKVYSIVDFMPFAFKNKIGGSNGHSK